MPSFDLGNGKVLQIQAPLISGTQHAVGVAQLTGQEAEGWIGITPLTADGQIVAGVGKLGPCFVRLGNSSRIVIYSNTAASGQVLFDSGTTGASEVWVGAIPVQNITFDPGAYVDITGTVTFSGSYRLD